MKNLILFSILALVFLSSCGTLDTSTTGEAYYYPGSSKVIDQYDLLDEEDYWLMGQDLNSLEFRDPFGIMSSYNRFWRQQYLLDDNQ